jgi:hypothetical protein
MDYQELLRRHDHPTHWEYPPGFDYQRATARFAQFVKDLSAVMGIALHSETGIYIQDASFHSEITLPLQDPLVAWIRFSNYGDMVTVSNDNPVTEETLQVIQNLLAQHGYVYVPADVLHTPYTGTNPGVTGIDTWWIRYFDWV